MKRFQLSALSCLAFIATTATANADIIISEIVDGPLSGGTPKWVELTNTGPSAVDLSAYSLGNMNNGGTTLGGGAASILSGILSPGASYVINFDNDNDPFNGVYGFDADHLMGGGYINGDDTVLLYLGAATGDGSDATLIDIYGVKGVNGDGEDWDYTDGYSYRLGTSGNNGVWDASDWFVGGLNSLEAGCGGDDACEEVNLQTLTTPGTHGAPSAGPDDCSGATAIAGDGVFAFDATTATTGAEGQNEYNCYSFGSSTVDNDIWFEWTADTDGTVNVSTCNDASADTKIAAYPGNSCPADGSSLACNDDADGCAGFTSAMDFACTSGSVYMIQVGHFPGTPGGIGNATITQTAAPTGPGTAYCFGDGSGTACPGTPGGAGEGCANSTGSGAVLAASGSDSASADDLVLSASNLPDNEPGLYFQGNNSVNGGNGITFGDGLRCAGFEARRLEVQTSAGGASATAGSIATGGLVNAGDTKYYQLWYRDGSGFNTTNGLEINWTL
jgi:hypothetical protein